MNTLVLGGVGVGGRQPGGTGAGPPIGQLIDLAVVHHGHLRGVAGDLVSWSMRLSGTVLSELGARWSHVQGVGAAADHLVSELNLGDDAEAVRSAAWLHDVGYAPALVQSGFHPIDGARFLRSQQTPELVVSLVAHHTGAEFEARGRGLGAELAVFDPPPQDLLDVVTFADLTTGPDGTAVTVDERLAEILRRNATPNGSRPPSGCGRSPSPATRATPPGCASGWIGSTPWPRACPSAGRR